MKLEIGMILEQETCDEILMDLKGNIQRVNPHIEHWVIEDITSKEYKLYNLDTQRTWKIKKIDMEYILYRGKYVRPMLKISEEVA